MVSIDSQAIRLWTLKRQIKSVHWTSKEFQQRVLKMVYIEKFDCILLFMVQLNSDGVKSYLMQLWDPHNLSLLCEVIRILNIYISIVLNLTYHAQIKMEYEKIFHLSFNPDCSHMSLIGMMSYTLELKSIFV